MPPTFDVPTSTTYRGRVSEDLY